MIVCSSASSEWFRVRGKIARVIGFAAVVAGLSGCAVSMPLPGLMDKNPSGSIPPDAAAISDPSASMRAEAPLPQAGSAKPGAPAN
jgi:hypothetical protein